MSARGRRVRAWITNIALLIVLAVLAVFATKAGAAVGRHPQAAGRPAGEQKTLEDRTPSCVPLHDDVMGQEGAGKFFKICNPGEDRPRSPGYTRYYRRAITSPPSTAPSARAGRTRPSRAARRAAGAQLAQAGCNWNGQVVFYAMSYVIHRPTVDASATVAGPWIFQGDCFTLPR
jgi:hypothetical protein